MHLIQWQTLKTKTNQHWNTTRESSVSIYTSDIPLPLNNIQITTYADNITITASHTKHHKAQQLIQPYLHKIYEWATTNNFQINTDKTITTLFTSDPAEYSTILSFKLNNQTLPTKHPKILGITLVPKPIFLPSLKQNKCLTF